MKTLEILDYTKTYTTNDDGKIIQDVIRKHFNNDESITLSFKGVNGTNSSFINTAIVDLVFYYDVDFIKSHLTFIKTSNQISAMIKKRFSFEVNRLTPERKAQMKTDLDKFYAEKRTK